MNWTERHPHIYTELRLSVNYCSLSQFNTDTLCRPSIPTTITDGAHADRCPDERVTGVAQRKDQLSHNLWKSQTKTKIKVKIKDTHFFLFFFRWVHPERKNVNKRKRKRKTWKKTRKSIGSRRGIARGEKKVVLNFRPIFEVSHRHSWSTGMTSQSSYSHADIFFFFFLFSLFLPPLCLGRPLIWTSETNNNARPWFFPEYFPSTSLTIVNVETLKTRSPMKMYSIERRYRHAGRLSTIPTTRHDDDAIVTGNLKNAFCQLVMGGGGN